MADLTIRDWMVIIGVLLITAVLLDAWRRVRSEKYSRVKVKLADPEDRGVSEGDEDLHWLKELPNGGARTVERGDLLRAAGHREEAAAAPVEAPVADNAPDADSESPDSMTAGMSAGSGETEDLDWLDGMGADHSSARIERWLASHTHDVGEDEAAPVADPDFSPPPVDAARGSVVAPASAARPAVNVYTLKQTATATVTGMSST